MFVRKATLAWIAFAVIAAGILGFGIGCRAATPRDTITVAATAECGIANAPHFTGCAALVQEYDTRGELLWSKRLDMSTSIGQVFE